MLFEAGVSEITFQILWLIFLLEWGARGGGGGRGGGAV